MLQTNTSQLGVQTETIVFTPEDENVTGFSAILPSQTITVTETVIAAAAGLLNTVSPIDLGTFYRGDVASTALSISNTASAGSAGLDVTSAVASGQATAAGSIADLAPGATSDSAVYAGIDTFTSGVKTGYVTLNYVSDSGNGNTAADGSATIEVIGTVYGPAIATLSAEPIYVHRGDGGGSATETIIVSNIAAANGYSENLLAQIVNFGTYVTAASGSADVAPGQSNNTALTATFSTANLGTYGGDVAVALQSDGTGIDSARHDHYRHCLCAASIDVDQYAVAAIEELSGNGTLTPTGVATSMCSILGTVAQYATPLGANLGVLNDVIGHLRPACRPVLIRAPGVPNTGFGPLPGTRCRSRGAAGGHRCRSSCCPPDRRRVHRTLTLRPSATIRAAIPAAGAGNGDDHRHRGGRPAAHAAEPRRRRLGRRAPDDVRWPVLRLPGGGRIRPVGIDRSGDSSQCRRGCSRPRAPRSASTRDRRGNRHRPVTFASTARTPSGSTAGPFR